MKKIFLFALFLFSFFLIPKDTFAKDHWRDVSFANLSSSGQSYTKIQDVWYGDIPVSSLTGNSYSWDVNWVNTSFEISNASELRFNFYLNTYTPDSFVKWGDSYTNPDGSTFIFSWLQEDVSISVGAAVLGSSQTSSICTATGANASVISFTCKLDYNIVYSGFRLTLMYQRLRGFEDYVFDLGLRTGLSSNFSVLYLDDSSSSNVTSIIQGQKEQLEETKKQTEEIKKHTEETKKQTETIKDSDVHEANDSASSFFNDFKTDDFGLTAVVTSPLNFIKSLSSSTCSPLELKVPFLPDDQKILLPCMTTIYETYFGDFLELYQTITFGIIAYFILVDILRIVSNLRNPDNAEVEVVDL